MDGERRCPGCGVVVRSTTVQCAVCGSEIGAGVYRERDPHELVNRLVDPQRQAQTRLLAYAPWPFLLVSVVLSIGTEALFGALSIAILCGLMVATAPAPAAPKGERLRAPSGRASEATGYLYVMLWAAFGIVIPAVLLFSRDASARGSIAIAVGWIGLVPTTWFRRRRVRDAEGFTGLSIAAD